MMKKMIIKSQVCKVLAYRISTELLGALIVSVVIGLLIDKMFDSKPIGLITLIILGFFAGLLNIYRLIRRIENSK